MGAPDILQHLSAAGVKLARNGGNLIATPRAAVTPDVLHLIREHKPELLAALQADTMPDPVTEARRQRLLAMLAVRPDIRYALITDDRADREAVILALATRGVMRDGSTVTCELRVPRAKYDPFLLLDLIERHGGTVH